MNHILRQHISEIKSICRKHYIRQLWVFGSVLTERFRPDSDIDFLYEPDHTHLSGEQSIDHFFAFQDELEHLLGHKVELVWYEGLRNPWFKAEIDETKVMIYDAAGEKVSV